MTNATPGQEKLLEKTKLRLMMMPGTMFFTTILFSLKYVWDQSIPTAAVDGRHMFVNPGFFEALTPKERIGVLIHEVMHVALNHITRQGNRHPQLFNMAGDYVINHIITSQGFSLPSGCLLSDDYTQDMGTEAVYDALYQKHKNKEMPIDLGPIGGDIKAPANAADASRVQQEIADIVLRAAQQTRQAQNGYGNIPGEVLVQLEKTINPKLPWNIIFQNFMSQFAKDDYSFRRPSRRYAGTGLVMPSPFSQAVCNVTMAVDCSGSVSSTEFSHFIAEAQVIQQTLKPDLLTVIDFDTRIHNIQHITQGTDIFRELKFHGRGGTNVTPVFEWAKAHLPEVLVIFTDGCFSQPPAHAYPPCPVVWLIHNNQDFTAPGGEVIHYDI